jgi:hypothetical protein
MQVFDAEVPQRPNIPPHHPPTSPQTIEPLNLRGTCKCCRYIVTEPSQYDRCDAYKAVVGAATRELWLSSEFHHSMRLLTGDEQDLYLPQGSTIDRSPRTRYVLDQTLTINT